MQTENVLRLAFRHAEWLSERRSLTAGNIANASTPGYRSRDLTSFEETLNSSAVSVSGTHTRHLRQAPGTGSSFADAEDGPAERVHSGNSVNLEQELLKASQISSAQAQDMGVVRAFHRMLLLSARG